MDRDMERIFIFHIYQKQHWAIQEGNAHCSIMQTVTHQHEESLSSQKPYHLITFLLPLY